jgi:phage gp36-like protein
MAVETILKQPAEMLRHSLRVAALSYPSAIDAVSVAPRGLVPGAPPLVATALLDAGAVLVDLTGGGDGERYLVTVRIHNAAGEIAEAELDVAVVEGAWAMPDGGTGYLSISDFVDRVGLPEVIAATDATGEGRIDRAMLISVLTDAQAIVDTYFASRYLVPLADPPIIVKKIVADLARVALYPRGAPDGIADQAKASTKLLERIQAGQVQIPVASPPSPAVSENPILIAPGRRAYPDGLMGY